MAELDIYLKQMLLNDGSDLHLTIGLPPKIRVHGELESLNDTIIEAEEMKRILKEICIDTYWQRFKKNGDLDFAYEIEGIARFRCNYLKNYFGNAAVFRQIPSEILSLEELKLPNVLRDVCNYTEGLICVTGPTGSGKSTTMAAMIDYINRNKQLHIITIEDPIEFVHRNKNSIIVHREVGLHSNSFANALKGAMRADPDIILLGEMRDAETIKLALTCASMGMLVFATLHTNSAPKTIDRIIDAFDAEEQPQVRIMLAQSLRGVISQLLCKTSDGKGRVASHEVLLHVDALPNIIRAGQISTIKTIIESNTGIGMCSMDTRLKQLMDKQIITAQEAYMKANDKKMFINYLRDDDEFKTTVIE